MAQVATLRLPILMNPFVLLLLFFLSAGVLVEKLYGIPFCKDLQKKFSRHGPNDERFEFRR